MPRLESVKETAVGSCAQWSRYLHEHHHHRESHDDEIDACTYVTYYMVQRPSWGVNRFSAGQVFPAFYETRKFITAFTSVRHLSLSWARSIQSTLPQTTSWSN